MLDTAAPGPHGGCAHDPLNLCFPLPFGENQANNNIDESYKDWIDP